LDLKLKDLIWDYEPKEKNATAATQLVDAVAVAGF
jgi:hypothetical protein